MSTKPTRPNLFRRPTPHPRAQSTTTPSSTPPHTPSPDDFRAQATSDRRTASPDLDGVWASPSSAMTPPQLRRLEPHSFGLSFGFVHTAPKGAGPQTSPVPEAPLSFAVPPQAGQALRASKSAQPAYPAGSGTEQTTQVVGMMDHDVLKAAQVMEAQGYSFVSATPMPPFKTALIFEHNPHTFVVVVGANTSEIEIKTLQMGQAGWRYFGCQRLGSFNQCLTYFR